MGKSAVFLDRDGTINIDYGYVFRKDKFVYIDGVVNGLKKLNELGYVLVIISNQSGIARGMYSEDDYKNLTSWMIEDLANNGVNIERTYYCPHLKEGSVKKYAIDCNCRKPKTELFYRAKNELNLDFKGSYAIGDRLRDLSICDETSVKGILIGDNVKEDSYPYVRAKTWDEVLEIIMNDSLAVK
ncbi:D-glycero-alpha-D-manno-heptose-1,7-bisphosphate 7-phosphatase [Lachnospiraceae bacterium C1.1]|nr:HAD family hydrolase [Lachnospiraceae bacterium C1.1]